MPIAPTDEEIRAHSAFPLVVRAARINVRVFWSGAPIFVAVGLYWVFEQRTWAFIVAGIMAVGNAAAQFYGFRQGDQPLSEISDQKVIHKRAWKLAYHDATPRLLRLLPGA